MRFAMATAWMLTACGGPEVELGAVPGTGTLRWGGAGRGDASVRVTDARGAEVLVTPVTPVDGEAVLTLRGMPLGEELTAFVEVTSDGRTRTSPEVSFTTPPPPRSVATFLDETWQPERSCLDGGHVLFGYYSRQPSGRIVGSGVGILDRDGDYVWAVENDIDGGQIGRPRPGRDGNSIVWNVADADREEDLGYVVQLAFDGSSRTQCRTEWGHHDFVELTGGGLAWLGYAFETDYAGIATHPEGVDVAVDTVHVGACEADVAGDTEIWNMFDAEAWPHPITYTNDRFLPGWMEYSHGNSLVALPDGSFLAMLRWIDALVKITPEGDLAWVLGGAHNEFTPVQGAAAESTGTEADLFRQAHFSEAWVGEDGRLHLLVFDNGVAPTAENPDPTSRLVEYTVDETARTVTMDWSYRSDAYENLLGDVVRMGIEGCDNLLVSFSTQGRLVELTREGEIVWEVKALSGAATTRVTFLPDLYDFGGRGY